MGQYHKVVNITKKEYVHPHDIGLGLKAREQLGAAGSGDILFALTMSSNGRGGGDLPNHEAIGRWAGDRVAVVGDYCEKFDYPHEENGYTDISAVVVDMLAKCFRVRVTGDGWARREQI